MKAPIAKIKPTINNYFNVELKDDYAWLRGAKWPQKIDEPEILEYLNQENEYFKFKLAPLKSDKNKIFEELKSKIKLDDQSTYTKKENYYYYTRSLSDKDYPIYCRKKDSISAKEEILLDVNELAKDQSFVSIGAFSVSPNNKLLAYSVDYTGGEQFEVNFKNLDKGEYLQDKVNQTIGNIIWNKDNSGIFYTPTSDDWKHDKVKYHKLGSSEDEDQLIFHEQSNLYYVNISKTSSKDYLLINIDGHNDNEIYLINLNNNKLEPKLVVARQDKIFYQIDHDGSYFYKYSNLNAKNYNICKCAEENIFENKWNIYIAEEEKKYLCTFDITKNYILLQYKHYGLAELKVININNSNHKTINFPDDSYSASIYGSNFEEDDIRVNYSSLARPNSEYQYNFNENKLELLKIQEIPSGHNIDDYQVERLYVETENVKVPVSLVYRKSKFKKDGSNPLYLYGYGSYGYARTASFSNMAISLADRGFVFAMAHIRGGDDLGQEWHDSAKFLNKKRTFDDFIACARYLIKSNYSSEKNIAIAGGSAGGLLMGNVLNQAADLFKLAIAHVPFVDVINSMLDESLPLTTGEFKEWGNPKEEEFFHYMKSYCPYQNVEKKAYPNLFVTAGLTDPRVGYWEAAKWVAKLRANKTDNNDIIFKTNMEFGHKGASGRFEYLKDLAEELAYIFHIFNIKI